MIVVATCKQTRNLEKYGSIYKTVASSLSAMDLQASGID